MRRAFLLAAVAVGLALPGQALADANQPTYNGKGQLIEAPMTVPRQPAQPVQLTKQTALALFES